MYIVLAIIGSIIGLEILIIGKNRAIFTKDEARDEKYKAFRFKEANEISRVFLWPMSFFAWHRVVIGATTMFLSGMTCSISTMFHDELDPPMGLSYFAMRAMLRINGIANAFALAGAYWLNIERPKVCYKKYLGPDWVADYDKSRAATTITNHMNFLDICLLAGL